MRAQLTLSTELLTQQLREPDEERRSLGRFAILWQITEAVRQDLEAVYLGYWIKNCKKMNLIRSPPPSK